MQSVKTIISSFYQEHGILNRMVLRSVVSLTFEEMDIRAAEAITFSFVGVLALVSIIANLLQLEMTT